MEKSEVGTDYYRSESETKAFSGPDTIQVSSLHHLQLDWSAGKSPAVCGGLYARRRQAQALAPKVPVSLRHFSLCWLINLACLSGCWNRPL